MTQDGARGRNLGHLLKSEILFFLINNYAYILQSIHVWTIADLRRLDTCSKVGLESLLIFLLVLFFLLHLNTWYSLGLTFALFVRTLRSNAQWSNSSFI